MADALVYSKRQHEVAQGIKMRKDMLVTAATAIHQKSTTRMEDMDGVKNDKGNDVTTKGGEEETSEKLMGDAKTHQETTAEARVNALAKMDQATKALTEAIGDETTKTADEKWASIEKTTAKKRAEEASEVVALHNSAADGAAQTTSGHAPQVADAEKAGSQAESDLSTLEAQEAQAKQDVASASTAYENKVSAMDAAEKAVPHAMQAATQTHDDQIAAERMETQLGIEATALKGQISSVKSTHETYTTATQGAKEAAEQLVSSQEDMHKTALGEEQDASHKLKEAQGTLSEHLTALESANAEVEAKERAYNDLHE